MTITWSRDMMQIVDFRYDWDKSEIVICMVHCDSGKHFYIREKIESELEGDEVISFWEIHTTMFIDVEFQHPN
jgi:hypothetical protein